MGKPKNKCKLCKVKRKDWVQGSFFGINCRQHFVPMVVIKEHKSNITSKEKEELQIIIKQRYPKLFPHIEQECLTDHFAVHLTKKRSKFFDVDT